MMGATEPLGLTCAAIIEEGFPRDDLERIVASMVQAAREAGAPVVTGDTKVMGKGQLDGIVLNTAGVGFADRVVTDAGLQAGDVILVTGTIGDHGMAVMARRHDLRLEGDLRSDVAPVNGLIREALRAGGEDVVAMKDPTRGGMAGVLHELAAKGRVGIVVDEPELPVRDGVRAAAEMIGIDPLLVANEGKAVLGVRPRSAEAVLAALRAHPQGARAAIVGRAVAERPGFGHPGHRVREAAAGGARGRAPPPHLLSAHARVLPHPVAPLARGRRGPPAQRRASARARHPGGRSVRGGPRPAGRCLRDRAPGNALRRRRAAGYARPRSLDLPELPEGLRAWRGAALHGLCGAGGALGRRRCAHARLDRHGGAVMCQSCGCGDPELVPVELHEKILAGNERAARHNREHFVQAGVLAVNVMGSPGSGKTALLEATARAAAGRGWRLGAVSADLATDNDARRLEAAGIRSRAITTGQACHLDAELVHRVAPRLRPGADRRPLHRERGQPGLPGHLRPGRRRPTWWCSR